MTGSFTTADGTQVLLRRSARARRMTLRVARDWRVGNRFPKSILYSDGGFLGVDGAFRFARNGVIQRAWEVREVRNGEVSVVANAPTSFSD